MTGNSTLRVEASPAPAAFLLAEEVDVVSVPGAFDEASQTWSDRNFACAGAKKHNEQM